MPAAIVHYLFAKRVQECLYKQGITIPEENAFLWGAQGTAVLLASHKETMTAAVEQLSQQPLSILGAWLQDCCQKTNRTACSCVSGFLCSEILERVAKPYINWCAAQLYAQDASQPEHIWKNEEESALDSIMLRYECGALPTEFSLLQALPKSEIAQSTVAEIYAYLLKKAMGLQNAQELCSQSAEECRRLYRRLTDHTGLKRVFYLRRENGRPHEISSRLRSFTEDGSFDYANIAETAWGTGETQDSRTFLQMYDETVPLAAQEIIGWNKEQDKRTKV